MQGLEAIRCTFNLKMFLSLGVVLDTLTSYAKQKESTEVKVPLRGLFNFCLQAILALLGCKRKIVLRVNSAKLDRGMEHVFPVLFGFCYVLFLFLFCGSRNFARFRNLRLLYPLLFTSYFVVVQS